jgi:hypothetical protein
LDRGTAGFLPFFLFGNESIPSRGRLPAPSSGQLCLGGVFLPSAAGTQQKTFPRGNQFSCEQGGILSLAVGKKGLWMYLCAPFFTIYFDYHVHTH